MARFFPRNPSGTVHEPANKQMPSNVSDAPDQAPPSETDQPFKSQLGDFHQIRLAQSWAKTLGHHPQAIRDFTSRFLQAELDARENARSRDPLNSPAGVASYPKNAVNGGSGIADGSPAPVSALNRKQATTRPKHSALDRYSRKPR